MEAHADGGVYLKLVAVVKHTHIDTTAVGKGTINNPMMKTTRNANTKSPKRLNAVVTFTSLPSMVYSIPLRFQQGRAIMFKDFCIRQQAFKFANCARSRLAFLCTEGF